MPYTQGHLALEVERNYRWELLALVVFDCKVAAAAAAAAVVVGDKTMVGPLPEDRRKVQHPYSEYNPAHQEELHGVEGHLAGLCCKTVADTSQGTAVLI